MASRMSVLVLLVVAAGVSAQDWPAFRGANGDGRYGGESAPLEWSNEKNVKWKVALPQMGNGSPVVVGDRVFLAGTLDEEGKRRGLYCFDRKSGEELWVRAVEFGRKMPTHKTNGYCASTPAADGERVVVWHGSAGLWCHDHEGVEVWHRDFGEFVHMWGYGTSPIIHGERVILHAGPGQRVFVAALELASGETVWRHDEPVQNDGQHNENKKYMGSWSTPVVVKVDGADQVLCSLATRLVALAPATGEVLWTCAGHSHARGDLSYSSAVITGDVCTVIGGFQGAGFGVRLGEGEGNVTESHRLWRRPKFPQNIGSGVTVGGYVYLPHATAGSIECLDPRTGEMKWRTRASRAPFWGSMVLVGERCYATDQRGRTIVFKPNPDGLETLASNELGEQCNSTPTPAYGDLFIRTHEHLYCISDS